ncbi:MAG: uroporphyrinogen decarboxylase family protein [Candidatus Zipacnadales bacterium]
MKALTERVLEQLSQPDPRLPTARARQAAVWQGREPDYLPLLCETAGQPWDGQDYTLAEQVEDPDKMLHEALRNVEPLLPVQSDAVLSIRPQFGVGTLTTPFGCEYELSARYGSPWVIGHASKADLSRIEPTDIDLDDSLVPRVCEVIRHFRKVLGDRLAVYMADTQSPFDIAHQTRGHELFTDLYDDPPFVHHLMELTTHVYIEASRRFKETIGEELTQGHYSGNLYMEGAGVRLCDDSGVLLSPAALEEFVFPYHQRALAAFGGGWVHWCGFAPQLVDGYLQLPAVKAINFGQPELYDPAEILARVLEAGKVYYGPWPRHPEEELGAYFDRLLACLRGQKQGLILVLNAGSEVERAMEEWHAAQERRGLS